MTKEKTDNSLFFIVIVRAFALPFLITYRMLKSMRKVDSCVKFYPL
ncbi:hypothetical protein HMPREF9151_00569 [Hoylesella saccharolytica F0055]|uniref:Uncharacterized protein n=1 Tax=Hoylesella saccharolytica F0055 TaxID=1127699 RepID=L1NI90_9BACT|nr:hypothetical protein HMPREF9151_00569 [Hoylesella saccharolytica F0055]